MSSERKIRQPPRPYSENPNATTESRDTTNVEQGDQPKKDLVINIQEIIDFKEYSEGISSVYMGHMTYYSTTLDVVTIYLKGQKLLYIESKTYCEMCLYFLMLPAIFISASCTVLSIALRGYSFGSVIVSGLTAVNSFILGIVTYLKLDAKSEAHKTATYQFDKLQTRCEFFAGKIYMINDPKIDENITNFFEDIEKKVTEIKDVNQFPIPEHIRIKYAKIYGQNVFSDMKIHKTLRNKNIQRIIIVDKLIKEFDHSKEVKGKQLKKRNKTRDNRGVWQFLSQHEIPGDLEVEEDHEDSLYEYTLNELKQEKERLINEIIEYRNVSIKMNKIFDEQINHHVQKNHNKCRCVCCCSYFCLKT